jgi:hypothetical protein
MDNDPSPGQGSLMSIKTEDDDTIDEKPIGTKTHRLHTVKVHSQQQVDVQHE